MPAPTPVAYPPEIPMVALDFGQMLGAVDGPYAGKFTGRYSIKPDHDRAVLTLDPVIYIDDIERSVDVTDGRAVALLPASTVPGATWTEVRYLVTPHITPAGSTVELTLPVKTVFLEAGAPVGGGYVTPTVSYWELASDAGSGEPSAGSPVALADVFASIVDRGNWTAATVYPVGSVVTELTSGRRFLATTARPAASTFTATGWVELGSVAGAV